MPGSETSQGSVVSELRERYPGSVRAVATYDQDSYSLQYSAEGIDDEYSPEDIESIYDDVVLQDVGSVFHETLFHEMGDVRGKIRIFENGTVAHFWPTDDEEGLFVSLDGDADPGIRTLYGIAEGYYG
ncbi:hypothetical protein EGH25_10225 [Haladaptatus sp. F3-133]|jgi:hypothetical protein|uniref:Uncharacterized protein n=1 Tax=Halorutilus salinus TaxID=2487751 RepID=A0A9Q4C5A9_9EURY|nr:hypothetical protein [Halorutilus salinus]MCX2819723.1 hypothetical protein [Halorutilus salinus]